MLVRVSDPQRLIDFVVFLNNSGFPMAERLDDGVAKLHSQDGPQIRETIKLWEAHSGVTAQIID
jgi:hypothetical protein